MASLMANGAKTAWTYTTGKDQDYTINAKTVYVTGADAAKYGGSAASAANISIPNGFKPRRAQVVSAGKVVRWPIVYSETGTLWTTPGTVVTLDLNGVDTPFTSTGTLRNEKAEQKAILIPA